jgi:hypothetical protein
LLRFGDLGRGIVRHYQSYQSHNSKDSDRRDQEPLTTSAAVSGTINSVSHVPPFKFPTLRENMHAIRQAPAFDYTNVSN